MKTNIVPIGNSKGIRIPKVVLQQCHIEKEVILKVEKDKIIIMPNKIEPRKDWEKSFKTMAENEDDSLVVDDKLDLAVGDWEW